MFEELKDCLKKVSKETGGYLDFMVNESPIEKEDGELYVSVIIIENKKSRPEMIYVPLDNILKK